MQSSPISWLRRFRLVLALVFVRQCTENLSMRILYGKTIDYNSFMPEATLQSKRRKTIRNYFESSRFSRKFSPSTQLIKNGRARVWLAKNRWHGSHHWWNTITLYSFHKDSVFYAYASSECIFIRPHHLFLFNFSISNINQINRFCTHIVCGCRIKLWRFIPSSCLLNAQTTFSTYNFIVVKLFSIAFNSNSNFVFVYFKTMFPKQKEKKKSDGNLPFCAIRFPFFQSHHAAWKASPHVVDNDTKINKILTR